MGRMAALPCLQVCAPAFQLDIFGVLEGHNPDPGTLVPAVAADRKGCQRHKVALSFSPLDPLDQEAAQGGNNTNSVSTDHNACFQRQDFSQVTSLRPARGV